jgi:hypothetical protein
MNGPLVVPPPTAASTRPQAEHEAIYRLFIVEGLSGDIAAQRLNSLFPGASYTRMSVGSYSHRQGWSKVGRSDSHGRIPPADPSARRSKFAPGPNSVILAELDPRAPDGAALGPKQCLWPVGKTPRATEMDRQLFCGDPAGEGPYCPAHHKAAYSGASKAEADAAKN